MIGTKKIPKAQLQEGLIEMQQITSVTLFSTGWSLVSGLYEYTYTNGVILSTSIVDIVPENGSVSIVKTADILPATSSSTGSVKIYATNLPTANIIVTLNVYNNTSQSVSYNSDWVRPGDWLTMPTIGSQEFIGLLAVTDDDANHIALSCAGAYTVDWGDGVTENVATGVKAQHAYTYSAISSGTLSTRGYKQVLVRVTPQAGQNLTTINLQQQNAILAKVHTVGWLDLSINGANITSIAIGGNPSTVRLNMCERVVIGDTGNITIFQSYFYNLNLLQSVSISKSNLVTNFSYMFYGCYSLKTLPLFNTSAGTNFIQMFYSCHTLRTIPLFNTSAGTTFVDMFTFCYSLQNIPLINTASGLNFQTMFRDCFALQQLPNLNTASGTNFASMLTTSSLAKGAFQGTRYAISYSGMCLSQSAIVDIFNGLGTAVGTPTITVSNNPGYAGLTAAEKLIATNKGFTIA